MASVIVITKMIDDDVMQILKGYVFRMYPTKEQEELINKKKCEKTNEEVTSFNELCSNLF